MFVLTENRNNKLCFFTSASKRCPVHNVSCENEITLQDSERVTTISI